ncbi:hypothetical protein U9M48_027457 [Paspalum notatum var. saurae]|uniref:Uncharacterized protein n=1 Tax=Paspalum notatum var. saurae TaxID=547442 RepID=A0AAQ3TUR8_PASNO
MWRRSWGFPRSRLPPGRPVAPLLLCSNREGAERPSLSLPPSSNPPSNPLQLASILGRFGVDLKFKRERDTFVQKLKGEASHAAVPDVVVQNFKREASPTGVRFDLNESPLVES